MAQPMSHLPTHSHLIDIETKELWKKVMATERHAHPTITLSEPLKIVSSKHFKDSKSAIAYYDSAEDVSAKFSKTDKVDVMCTKETGAGGDYTFLHRYGEYCAIKSWRIVDRFL